MVAAFDRSHFALYPVVVDRIVAGILHADRRTLYATEEMRFRLEQVRDLLARGIARARLTATLPAPPA